MALIRSLYRMEIFSNPSINESEIFRIEEFSLVSLPDRLFLYMYDSENTVVRAWVYGSEDERQTDLRHILKRCPHLTGDTDQDKESIQLHILPIPVR